MQINFQQIEKDLCQHGISFNKPMVVRIPNARQVLYLAMEHYIGKSLVWLPEYNQVAEWLTDNRGRGLCLYGLNGNGKTILIQKVIPVIFYKYCRKVMTCINYQEMNSQPDLLLRKRLLSIDDVGAENEGVIYGNRRWIFPDIMDMAEKRNNLVVISSNLNATGFVEKYGARTLERLISTTKRVEFKNLSMRQG